MSKENNYIPAIIGMSQMAKLLQLSRSRLYQLIDAGILLPPAHLLSNKRPIYTREMALCNLEAKTNNTGINGEIVMFYTARNSISSVKKVNRKSEIKVQNKEPKNKYQSFIDDLESLGLEDVSVKSVESALSDCFTDTVPDLEDDETLTAVFRYLKCQDSEHKPRA
jgi:hypothetical protein